ncbi:MAG TPA: hypothetical protein VFX59_21850, partial [Polyangiales bacterium]|nr:hypothetical protein [Polyangiales bacterium]
KRDDTPECVLALYDRPRDFPDHVVVRQWTFNGDGTMAPDPRVTTFDVQALTPRGAISAARSYCKRMGLSFVPRCGGDDAMLLESWRGRPRMAQAAE